MLKFICLSMAMLVTGCTQIHEENSSSNSKIEAPANVEYQDTVTLVTDPYGPLLNTSASTNDGYYELLLSADGTANNILYTDFATKQRIYLCNAPNCTHDKVGIGAQAGVPGNVKSNEQILGTPAIDAKNFMKSSAVYKKLPEMYATLNAMQKEIEELKKQLNK